MVIGQDQDAAIREREGMLCVGLRATLFGLSECGPGSSWECRRCTCSKDGDQLVVVLVCGSEARCDGTMVLGHTETEDTVQMAQRYRVGTGASKVGSSLEQPFWAMIQVEMWSSDATCEVGVHHLLIVAVQRRQ